MSAQRVFQVCDLRALIFEKVTADHNERKAEVERRVHHARMFSGTLELIQETTGMWQTVAELLLLVQDQREDALFQGYVEGQREDALFQSYVDAMREYAPSVNDA